MKKIDFSETILSKYSISPQNLQKVLLDSSNPPASLVVVYKEWCPYCRAMSRDLLSFVKKIQNHKNLALHMVEFDAQNNIFQVSQVPSVFIFDPKKKTFRKNPFALGPMEDTGYRSVPVDSIIELLQSFM